MKKQTLRTIAGLVVASAIWIGASTSAHATLITLAVGAGGSATDHILGEVIPPETSGGLSVRDEAMIDTLRVMGLGVRTAIGINPEYYRSTTAYGSLPDAIQTGHVEAGSIGAMNALAQYISIQLSSTTTYQYLVGTYDGPNGGAEVWYIGNVAAGTEIQIPRYAHPVPASNGNGANSGINDWPQNLVQTTDQYQITTWTMYNPTAVPVPEPTTVLAGALLLLPFGASTLRFFRKNRTA